MSESGSRDAAAGLAAHSKDASNRDPAAQSQAQSQTRDPLAVAGDSAEELLRALLGWVHKQPLTALVVAGTAGLVIGRLGKYV